MRVPQLCQTKQGSALRPWGWDVALPAVPLLAARVMGHGAGHVALLHCCESLHLVLLMQRLMWHGALGPWGNGAMENS